MSKEFLTVVAHHYSELTTISHGILGFGLALLAVALVAKRLRR